MKKYYLFEIRHEFYKVYKKNSYALFKTLENLHKLKKEDLSYGISIFNQICLRVNKKDICSGFNEYIRINNDKFLINEHQEESVVTVKNSCILYTTNVTLPPSMAIIYPKYKYIFVVDFKNKEYFWLEEHIGLKNKYMVI
ncbi:MAG: hypothetical protein NC181_05165 [Clostridium sp.]|nr:hypothetical protein [Clostridium sp.]MCM1443947.1 hypothetical protein [Candidatus Amulumruptor caecigallinarius]